MADSAINRYLLVAQTYPKSEKAPTSLFKAAQALEQKGDLASAEKYYAAVLDQYPSSTEARRAKERVNAIRKK